MGAPERRLLAVLTALGGLAAGCASGRAREDAPARPLPPQAVTTRTPSPEAAPPPAATTASAPTGSEARDLVPSPPSADDPTVLVIDDPAGDEGPATLVEAAARARDERSRMAPPMARITNDNLSAHAEGGVLTIASPSNEGEDGEAADGAAPGEPTTEETYWRQRGLEIRERWREAHDAIPLLSAKVEELRTRFYATDDPYVRDGQVKPEWDRAIADLEEARFRAGQGAEEVAQYLEDGRRAGALPGWLREGIELEPEPVVETVDGYTLEPGEPPPYEAEPIDP